MKSFAKSLYMLVMTLLLIENLRQINSKNLKNNSNSLIEIAPKKLKLGWGIKYIKAEDGKCLSIAETSFDLSWEVCKNEYRFQWDLTVESNEIVYIKNYTDDGTSRYLTINQKNVLVYMATEKLPLKYTITEHKIFKYDMVQLSTTDELLFISKQENNVAASETPISFKFTSKYNR